MSVTSHSSTSYRPSRQIRRIKGLHRLLHHRLSVPLGMTESVLKQLKHAWNPSQVRRRSALAAELERSDQDTFLGQYGYLRLEPYSLPGMREALDYCSAEYDKARAAGSTLERQSASVKEFLVSVIKDEELLDHPELFSLRDLARHRRTRRQVFRSDPGSVRGAAVVDPAERHGDGKPAFPL